VRRSAGRIEIQTSGPREEVVPRLLELARSDPGSEVSSLALSSVENLLGAERSPAPETDPAGDAGVKQWLERRVSGLSSMAPPFLRPAADAAEEGEVSGSPEPEGAAMLRRLDELERLWNDERKGSS
jgi:hypothetical protein